MSTAFHLETPSSVLRPLTPGDSPPMLEMSQEPCARRWLPSQVYRDEQHAAAGVEYLMKQFDLAAHPKTNAFVLGIEKKVSGRLIGHVGLSPLFDTVEVGFGITESEQGHGYATEAVARVCAWALEHFSLPAVIGVTDAENLASQRVLLRSGFTWKEARTMRLQGVDRPVIIYELRKQEPKPGPDPTASAVTPAAASFAKPTEPRVAPGAPACGRGSP